MADFRCQPVVRQRELLLASADALPEAERLRIRIHSLANPRSNAALTHLCETVNGLELCYPGTDWKLVYEAPDVARFLRPCQEF